MLLPTAFEKAAEFLKNKARPLELSRFNSVFNRSKEADILMELEKFQNPDGGFGNALEPDIRAPESSAVCTSIAFQIFRAHHVSKDESLVKQSIRYLAETFDSNELHWRIIPESAESSPHAPWWNQTGREKEFREFSLNPTAEILGYLLDFQDQAFDESLINQLMNRVIEKLKSLETIEMHDLLCCLRLLESKNLSSPLRSCVEQEIKRLLSDTVAVKPEQWAGYRLRPLQVVTGPTSPFIRELEEAVSLNLDYEIEEQQEDGSWTPPWSWGENAPEVWNVAKREWSGVLTLDKLMMLQRFDRLEKNQPESGNLQS